MSDLARSAMPRQLVFRGVRYEVRPPTVREALEVLFSLEAVREGHAEHEKVLRLSTLPGWLGPEVTSVYDDMTPIQRVRTLKELLYQGAPPPPAHGEGGAPPQWTELLCTYCMAFGGGPWEVYNEVPFPFFLLLVRRADAQIARSLLSQVDLFTLPHLGKGAKAAYDRLRNRAAYGPPPGTSKADIEADRAALKNLFGVPSGDDGEG